MPSAILYDQSELAYRMGTGIATYGRNLAAAAQGAGFGTATLLSTDIKIDTADPVFAEVSLFDYRRPPLVPWLEPVTSTITGVARAPFGYRPRRLTRAGVVLPPQGAAPVLEATYVSRRLFNAARAHFYVYGRFVDVRLPQAPALFHATHPLAIRVRGCPNIVTIHDLVPLRLPFMTLDNKRYILRLLKALVARADHVVTVSEFSRRDIMELLGVPEGRITNTYQAVTMPARAMALSEAEVAEQVGHLFGLDPGEYYLFVGALEPKKTVARLIDAYAASGSRRTLVLVGGDGWQNQAELSRINDQRFGYYRIADNTVSAFRQVQRIPYLPAEQLLLLLRGARALLFPSVFEGFGLPVLEAMTVGTPVVTSDRTSMPEIAGGAALLVDPMDVGAMSGAIRQLDNDGGLLADLASRGRVRAAAFSMAHYQTRLRDLYDRLLGCRAP
jgi:glycosyltransferase involved in cell wall biosynthesis